MQTSVLNTRSAAPVLGVSRIDSCAHNVRASRSSIQGPQVCTFGMTVCYSFYRLLAESIAFHQTESKFLPSCSLLCCHVYLLAGPGTNENTAGHTEMQSGCRGGSATNA